MAKLCLQVNQLNGKLSNFACPVHTWSIKLGTTLKGFEACCCWCVENELRTHERFVLLLLWNSIYWKEFFAKNHHQRCEAHISPTK